jgi:hypothetical protein
MVPDVVRLVDGFVLTPNGKIDRTALPLDDGAAVRELDDADRPSGEIEELVAAAWSQRIGHVIPRTSNVFDVGGNSLLAVAVFRELQDVAGAGLALTDLFRHPTIAALGSHITGLVGAEGADPDEAPAGPVGADRGARRRQARLGRAGQGPA